MTNGRILNSRLASYFAVLELIPFIFFRIRLHHVQIKMSNIKKIPSFSDGNKKKWRLFHSFQYFPVLGGFKSF